MSSGPVRTERSSAITTVLRRLPFGKRSLNVMHHKNETRDDRSTTAAPFDAAQSLCFMHIPKTAGTALKIALAESLNETAPVYGLDHSLFGIFRDFDSMAPAERAEIFADGAALPREAKLILGHFSYRTLRQARPNGQIISVLREPISRLLSHWLFWRQHTEDMLVPVGDWANFVRLSRRPLAGFLDEPTIAPQTDNASLRMLLGDHPLLRPDRFIAEDADTVLLAAAEMRLDALAFVDVIENPGFVSNLQSWLGKDLPLRRLNETPAVPPEYRVPLDRELSDHTCALLARRSRLDLRLWEMIVERRMPGVDRASLRQQTLMRSFARYGALLAA